MPAILEWDLHALLFQLVGANALESKAMQSL